ncbi:MAG: AraC family transcriptional regulator [Sphaerobacteraceae bacterium]|nr:MAG: AraC family transcriptional regulator [Sphaerobacteraceae bacterium]
MELQETPEVIKRDEQWSAIIPVEASLNEWDKTIQAIPRLISEVQNQGIHPASPLFYRYRRMGDQHAPFALEIGFALEDKTHVEGELLLSAMEPGTYVTYLHRGHPDQLFEVDPLIREWAANEGIEFSITDENGYEAWTGRYEFFLTNPDDEPDPNNWEIKLAWLTTG